MTDTPLPAEEGGRPPMARPHVYVCPEGSEWRCVDGTLEARIEKDEDDDEDSMEFSYRAKVELEERFTVAESFADNDGWLAFLAKHYPQCVAPARAAIADPMTRAEADADDARRLFPLAFPASVVSSEEGGREPRHTCGDPTPPCLACEADDALMSSVCATCGNSYSSHFDNNCDEDPATGRRFVAFPASVVGDASEGEAATRLRFNEFDDASIEHIRETCGELLAEGVDSSLLRAALDAAYRLAASLHSTRAALEEARKDAERYRALRDAFASSVGGGVEVNDDALVYQNAEPGEEVRIYFYPDTPVGFYNVHGATLDEAADALIAGEYRKDDKPIRFPLSRAIPSQESETNA